MSSEDYRWWLVDDEAKLLRRFRTVGKVSMGVDADTMDKYVFGALKDDPPRRFPNKEAAMRWVLTTAILAAK